MAIEIVRPTTITPIQTQTTNAAPAAPEVYTGGTTSTDNAGNMAQDATQLGNQGAETASTQDLNQGVPADTTGKTQEAGTAKPPTEGVPQIEPSPTMQPPKEVSYVETPPPPTEKLISVMGGDNKADQMYPSEAAAVYACLRDFSRERTVMMRKFIEQDSCGMGEGMGEWVNVEVKTKGLSMQEMCADLKSYYGIDAVVVGGGPDGAGGTIVNRATGNVLMHDANGNGVLEMSDGDFVSALKGAGIDPDLIPNSKDALAAATNLAMMANELMAEVTRKVGAAYASSGEAPSLPGVPKCDVKGQTAKLRTAMAHENELKKELVELKLTGVPQDVAAQNQARHDAILAEIETQRQQVILPISKELGQFVTEARKALAQPAA